MRISAIPIILFLTFIVSVSGCSLKPSPAVKTDAYLHSPGAQATSTPQARAVAVSSSPAAEIENSGAGSPAITNKGSKKKGILLPGAYSFCEDIETLNIGWYYRNSVDPAPDCPSPDPRFVPRLTNGRLVSDESLAAAIENAKASGWIIGFVEPNIPWWDGSGEPVTPLEGAKNWRKIEEAALPAGIKLVSPSPSRHDPGYFDEYGYTWIWAMVDAYENKFGAKPHFDAMGWNYYDNNPHKFQEFFSARRREAVEKGYDVPFWILEYAGECWNTDKYPTGNDEIMTRITPSLESTPWISRYVWFTNRISPNDPWAENSHSCTLIDPETGELTSLGEFYAEQ